MAKYFPAWFGTPGGDVHLMRVASTAFASLAAAGARYEVWEKQPYRKTTKAWNEYPAPSPVLFQKVLIQEVGDDFNRPVGGARCKVVRRLDTANRAKAVDAGADVESVGPRVDAQAQP